MAKKAIFDTPGIGLLMRGMRHISVDRSAGAGAYREAVRALEKGEIVGVFPEATISTSFELKAFKTGAARMAISSGAPIVPMVIWGGQRVWTKRRKPDLRRRRVPISIAIGEPLRGEDVDRLTATLQDRMGELLATVQAQYPDSHAGAWWAPTRLGGTAPAP
jgi:1-acyl-sn-glycerol-3-phosphate acyltransferase